MPKKTKSESTPAAAPTETNIEPSAAADTPVEAKPVKKAGAKKEATAKQAAKKPVAKKSAPKPAAKKSSSPAKAAAEPTDEEIRIRAYFIAERRQQMALGGDPNNDWIQAREELLAERRAGGGRNGNGAH